MEVAQLEQELKKTVSGEVRFDHYSRALYSTDASIYQIEPLGVVIPRSKEDVIATVEMGHRYGVPILPRGGGTSLAGQAVAADDRSKTLAIEYGAPADIGSSTSSLSDSIADGRYRWTGCSCKARSTRCIWPLTPCPTARWPSPASRAQCGGSN